MTFASIIFFTREIIARLRGKDTMPLILEKYRYYGVNIPNDGGGIRAFSPILSPEPYLITVGRNTTISTGVKFITHDNAIVKSGEGFTDLVGPIIVGDNCFIGMNAILLPGVELANGIIVGAGSVVAKSFHEENIVIAGNPAKKICSSEFYYQKNRDKAFNFRGMSSIKKKELINTNTAKLLHK